MSMPYGREPCPNLACSNGLVARAEDDPLARYGGEPCTTCGGAGSVLMVPSRFGNVGIGKSGKMPANPPAPGTIVREIAARCICDGGTHPCTGACGFTED
jgi:hypothetical protein